MDRIQIPAAFVKENKKMLAKQCLLKTDEAGTLWEAKVVRDERSSKYNICEGEWSNFVEYHKLEVGDVLFFYLIDKSMFHVQPYTRKCCRNLPPFDELSSSEEEENAPSRDSSKLKTKQNESSASGKGCNTMFEQQSKTVYDVRKTVMPKLMDKEGAIAYQRAKAFKSKNPFFICLMQPTYTSAILYVRLTFARKYFGEKCSKLVLRVPGRGSWSVKCSLGQVQAKIKGGWREFVLDNKLKLGDACVFEVIGGNPLFIDVTIFRAAGSTPMRETD